MKSTLLLLMAGSLVLACRKDGDSDTKVAETGTPGDGAWSGLPTLVTSVPNIDDDDENGTADWEDASAPGDDDLGVLSLDAALFDSLPAGGVLRLTLTDPAEGVRIGSGSAQVLGGGTLTWETTEAVDLGVEFADFLTPGTLLIEGLDASGEVLQSSNIRLLGAPLLMNHHLQPGEEVWAVDVGTNAAFLDGFRDILGESRFSTAQGNQYQWDVWIQDEMEFGTSTAPGQRMDIVIDSIRDRGLDRFPENVLEGPDTTVIVEGSGRGNTYDSFGNLECSPPVTVAGVEYPFGRIYYGASDRFGPSDGLTGFLASQQIQAPLALDTTSWLCVGHVDEFMSFIEDPGSERGFKLVYNDVPSAWAILEAMDPDTPIPYYTRAHGYSTVGEILDDAALRNLNDDIQADHLDPLYQQVLNEFGLTDDDVILMPALFEEPRGCGAYVAGLFPALVNYATVNVDGVPHAFVADPFFREDARDQSSDVMIQAVRDIMPAGVELHFIDDWNDYHVMLGEVHCGSNTFRTPNAEWWTSALHLLEGR